MTHPDRPPTQPKKRPARRHRAHAPHHAQTRARPNDRDLRHAEPLRSETRQTPQQNTAATLSAPDTNERPMTHLLEAGDEVGGVDHLLLPSLFILRTPRGAFGPTPPAMIDGAGSLSSTPLGAESSTECQCSPDLQGSRAGSHRTLPITSMANPGGPRHRPDSIVLSPRMSSEHSPARSPFSIRLRQASFEKHPFANRAMRNDRKARSLMP